MVKFCTFCAVEKERKGKEIESQCIQKKITLGLIEITEVLETLNFIAL